MRSSSLKYLLPFCMAGILITHIPASAQAQSVGKRLDILEKQLRAVQRKIFKPGSKFASQKGEPDAPVASGGNVRLADIDSRIAQIETQFRQLTGRIEESNYQTNKMKQQMETMARDYEFRLKELERSGATPSATIAPIIPEDQPKAVDILPGATEDEQYDYAQKLVTKGQYARAELALSAFLKRYPKTKLSGNAQYWLGQTYYVRKMYTRATRAFLGGYNNYPKHAKAPAFLLKIGMSLNAMGEKADACDAYRELKSRFPESVESKNRRVQQEKKAGCP